MLQATEKHRDRLVSAGTLCMQKVVGDRLGAKKADRGVIRESDGSLGSSCTTEQE